MKEIFDFFVVGCQKSGSTWIHNNLKQHQEITMPDKDESHFFDINYYQNKSIGMERNGKKLIGESTSSYFRCKYLPQRLHNHNPNSKIIVSLRNPIHRAFSHYWHERKKGKINFSFEELFENFDLFENWIETGFYNTHLKNYLKYFNIDSIFIIIQEKMLIDKASYYKSILDFLGVDPSFKPSNLENIVNPTIINDSSDYNEYMIGISNETQSKLINIYKENIRELENLCGIDFSIWNIK